MKKLTNKISYLCWLISGYIPTWWQLDYDKDLNEATKINYVKAFREYLTTTGKLNTKLPTKLPFKKNFYIINI